MRARELGIEIGGLAPGPADAITDVAGVRVGHTTLIEGDDVRTGVTVVLPHGGNPGKDPLFAGCHTLNGSGELTGLEWVRESGLLSTPVGLTNTCSVGVVRDALIAAELTDQLPVVGETWDGGLNDIMGMHVRPEHVRRQRLRVDGLPVGELIGDAEIPLPRDLPRTPDSSSIIIVVATDAPLLPGQCARLAQRAGFGIARTGGVGEHTSGDFILAFATGNRGLGSDERALPLRMLADRLLTPLFYAVIDATEEAILNAMLAAPTMTGSGAIVSALTPEALAGAMARLGRPLSPSARSRP